jgi:phospholipase C
VNPNGQNSEHPPGLLSAGQSYVTGLVNAIMAGPNWSSTAIFISWDDWGGFYDHVVPPVVDQNGYGLRVPGLLVSPYARRGLVDHQTLSFDAYDKFIEDVFLKGVRIDPGTDGRPDSRPTVREKVPVLGDLSREFDFSQPPRPPLVLSTSPSPGPASQP